MADDHKRGTDRHHPHDEQRSWHVETGLQLKDQLWTVPSLEECQPFLMTPATEYRSLRAMTRQVHFSPGSKKEVEKGHTLGPNDWVN